MELAGAAGRGVPPGCLGFDVGADPVGVDGAAQAMRWNWPAQRVGESHPAARGSMLALALALAYIFLSSGVLLTP